MKDKSNKSLSLDEISKIAERIRILKSHPLQTPEIKAEIQKLQQSV